MPDIHQANPGGLSHAPSPEEERKKILQRPDLVWSRMKLEPGEVLLVKLGAHMQEHAKDIGDMVNQAFKGREAQVLIYLEGDLEFTKVVR